MVNVEQQMLNRRSTCQCASINVDIGARRRLEKPVSGNVRAPFARHSESHSKRRPSSAQLHRSLHCHNLLKIYHVSDASYNRIFKFLTLPSYLPSCPKVLPKADQERPSLPPSCFPVAGLRLYCRHNHHPSKSSSRIRQLSQ